MKSSRSAALVLSLLVFSLLASGCLHVAASPDAREVLARGVERMMSWKTYRYSGTSEIQSSDERLNNKGTFDTILVARDNGACDGRMVVDSPGYSYQTYSFEGAEYTLVEGQDWKRVLRPEKGYGLITAGARRIIARFDEIVDDVRLEGETPDTYTISLVMGERYYRCAAEIAAQAGGAQASAGCGYQGRDTRMVIVLSRKDFCFRSVSMGDSRAADGSTPSVSLITKGEYSQFDRPVDIRPPAEALAAPEVGPEEAPPTQQPM